MKNNKQITDWLEQHGDPEIDPKMEQKIKTIMEENKLIVNDNTINAGFGLQYLLPLEMRFRPKEDITTFELANCLPYLLGQQYFFPRDIDLTETHFRHFEIIDRNEY